MYIMLQFSSYEDIVEPNLIQTQIECIQLFHTNDDSLMTSTVFRLPSAGFENGPIRRKPGSVLLDENRGDLHLL
jgi:hypothetical protein